MYLSLHAVLRINVKITWILYHLRQKMQKCKTMLKCSMFSIISATHMLRLSIRQSTSNSITPSITSCLKRNWRPECFLLSMYPSSNFTVSNRLIFLKILDLTFHKMDRTVFFLLRKIIEGVLLTPFFVRIFNLEIYLQQLEYFFSYLEKSLLIWPYSSKRCEQLWVSSLVQFFSLISSAGILQFPHSEFGKFCYK